MVFIVAVVLVATRTSMAGAVVTALLCFASYNFFFIEPRYTFHISAHRGVATVVLFLLAALVAGRLAAKLRMQVLALRAANAHAIVLQGLGQRLSTAADLGQVLQAGRLALERNLDAAIWLQVGKQVSQSASATLSPIDQGAIDWVMAHGQAAGRFTDTLAGARWWFLPLRDEQGPLGVVGLRWHEEGKRLGFEQRRLAEAMSDDIAQAVLRTRLVADLSAPASAAKPNVCARRCCHRYRMTCVRRWRRWSARPAA